MVTTWTAGALAAAPSVPRWTMLCAAAEAVGMAASATATRTAQAMVVDGAADPISGLALIAAAGLGLIMGAVLGAGQALVLRGRVPHPCAGSPAAPSAGR